ncbi:hypothetical protein C5167_006024 [Papaver somniferum]|uniref:Uncharacterized protein n=1 Tax=Papaver somniferum TaxID=3469 RepID=A0A4Y7JC95_PAPSO|nr:hypothetical protein C5167_006024 [Papaver somniferum]
MSNPNREQHPFHLNMASLVARCFYFRDQKEAIGLVPEGPEYELSSTNAIPLSVISIRRNVNTGSRAT